MSLAGNWRQRRSRRRGLALALADAVGINVAFAAAWWLRYVAQVGGPVLPFNFVPYPVYAPWGLGLTAILLPLYRLEGLYRRRRRLSWLDSVASLAAATVVGVALLTLIIFGVRPLAQSRLMLPYAALTIVALLAFIRLGAVQLERRKLRRGEGVARTLIVGAGEVGRAVMRNVVAQPEVGFHIVGFLDDDPAKQSQAIGRFEALGATGDLGKVIRSHRIDEAIIALPWQCRDQIVDLVAACAAARVRARIVPDLFQMSLNHVDLESLNGIPLIGVQEMAISGWRQRSKRGLDVVLAAVCSVVASPLLLVIALAVKLTSDGPVLFRQQRVGRDGRVFTLFKFRSMHPGADDHRDGLRHLSDTTGPIFKIRRDPRRTPVGRILRRASLDELPQLWNVLRGDMSLVGPRPPMPTEVAEYKDWHRRRLEIAPGLTGLWQVSGRSDLTFDEMVMLDLFYAENWSLGLDLKILLRTVPTVLLGRGAY